MLPMNVDISTFPATIMLSPNSTKTEAATWAAKGSNVSEGDDGSLGATKQEILADESFEQKNFAQKLFALLDVAEFQEVFHWLPSGDVFCVTDQSAFESKIMAKHFPSAKFQSFTRRMRRWGFHRVESTEQRSNGIIMFMCPHFRRGRPDLCKLMCDDRQIKKSKKADHMAGVDGLRPHTKQNSSSKDVHDVSERFRQIHAVSIPPRVWPSAIPTAALQHWNPSTTTIGPAAGDASKTLPFQPASIQLSAGDIFVHGANTLRRPFAGSALYSAVPSAQITVSNNTIPPLNAFHHSIHAFQLQHSTNSPRGDLAGIRAAIDRLDAELAVVSRMKELKQRSLSLAAARALSSRKSSSFPGQGSLATSSSCFAPRRSWNA